MNSKDSAPASIDESARDRFAAAWASGTPEPIDGFLPPPGDPRHLPTLEELVGLELEYTRKNPAGPPPVLEDYLARFPQLRDPATLTRLVLREYLARVEFGDGPFTAEYEKRFPHLPVGSELETVVGDHRAERAAPHPDGYEVLGEVGKGGMGVVYEARESRLGRVVALKTPKAGGGDHRRFLTEARIAAALEHPGIVPVHELVTPNGGDPFYTMKLVRGRRLDDAIREFHTHPDPPAGREVERRRLLEACLAVIRTMAFAHSKGYVHRDLKPANIVLGEYGETVILDWGLAKRLAEKSDPGAEPEVFGGFLRSAPRGAGDGLTMQGEILGTPAYMAPEQAAGRIDLVDERSDVYALGAILYHVLTNAPPHTAANAREVLRLVRDAEPPPPREVARDVPRPLEAVCLRAMAKDRDDRYPAAADLARDLERFLDGEPVSAYRERPAERFARWSRRHRTLVATATVAAVLAAVGAAAGLYLDERATGQRREQAANFAREQDRAEQEYQQSLALQRQQRAFDKQRADAERRAEVERAATADEALGLAKFRSGRFDEADQLLGRAAEGIGGVPELHATAARIAAGRDDARRLADFYRLKDRADSLAAMTSLGGSPADRAVISNIELALRRVNVLGGSAEKWWERLPGRAGLPAELLVKLEEDSGAAIGLLSLWRAKNAMLAIIPPAAEVRAARDYLAMIQRYDLHHGRPLAASGQVLDVFLRAAAGDKLPAQPLAVNPRTAADHYFLGVTHLMLTVPETTDPITRAVVPALRTFYGEAFRVSGLGESGHRERAEQYLRRAISLEPTHYWAHFSLAQTLAIGGDWVGAEHALTTCVGLRANYMPAYITRAHYVLTNHARHREMRAAVASLTWPPVVHRLFPGPGGAVAGLVLGSATHANADGQAELIRRCLDGIRSAPSAIRLHPQVRWNLYLAMSWAGDSGYLQPAITAIDTYVFESVAGLRLEVPTDLTSKNAIRHFQLQTRATKDPLTVRDLSAAIAVAHLLAGNARDAEAVAKPVLDADPGHPRALAVRGVLHLRGGRWKEAAVEFDRALARQPDNELAAVGRAVAGEKAGEWEVALAGFDRVLKLAGPADAPSSLHLVGHLGRARALANLDRGVEARKALDAAAANDPLAADTLAAKLFPPAKE